ALGVARPPPAAPTFRAPGPRGLRPSESGPTSPPWIGPPLCPRYRLPSFAASADSRRSESRPAGGQQIDEGVRRMLAARGVQGPRRRPHRVGRAAVAPDGPDVPLRLLAGHRLACRAASSSARRTMLPAFWTIG